MYRFSRHVSHAPLLSQKRPFAMQNFAWDDGQITGQLDEIVGPHCLIKRSHVFAIPSQRMMCVKTGPVVADTCAQGSERIPICTGQHASAASLALSEPVLVAASDADSTRSVMTAAGAASVDCGRIAAGQFPASGSAGSLSRGSLSMVLCEDFGTALCDAGDLEDAALPPADSQAAAAATAASDSGCRPEEGASKRRRSAEAQGARLVVHQSRAFPPKNLVE